MGISTHYLLQGSVVYCVDSLFGVFEGCVVIYSAFPSGCGQKLVFSIMLSLQFFILFSLKNISSSWISNDVDTEFGHRKVWLPYTLGQMSKGNRNEPSFSEVLQL